MQSNHVIMCKGAACCTMTPTPTPTPTPTLHPASSILLPAETFPCALTFSRGQFCDSCFLSGGLSTGSRWRRRSCWRRSTAPHNASFSSRRSFIAGKGRLAISSMQYKQDGDQDPQTQQQVELQRGLPRPDDATAPGLSSKEAAQASELQCFGTGLDVECVILPSTSDSMVDGASAFPTREGTLPTSSPSSTVRDDSKSTRSSASNESKSMPWNAREENTLNVECIGTGTDVECIIPSTNGSLSSSNRIASRAAVSSKSKEALLDSFIDSTSETTFLVNGGEKKSSIFFSLKGTWEYLVLISPFFFWGTAMVAMKGVLPKAGPLFVAATRLIPSGFLLIAFAVFQNRKQPSGLNAWLAIALFAFVDASCFQGFLAEGLKRTSAGLGSVIIDSQPLTVAVLASLLFGETIGALGVLGLATGVLGLLLLEVPPQVLEDLLKGHGLHHMGEPTSTNNMNDWSIWDSGEWWMLLAAQSMAVGTVMVRWLCQFADPVMATGWHMVLGGIPLLALASFQHDPAVSGHIQDLELGDWLALFYTSVFGSAVSYGVFFYNASRGSLTKLSSLTFLTPMFAALFGYILLDETLSPIQIVGAFVTLGSIYLINAKASENAKDEIQ